MNPGPSLEKPGGRLRVAWASPLPPSGSGIGDYAAEILPALAERVDLTLVLEPRAAVATEVASRYPTLAAADLPGRAAEFDVILYHVGNNGDYHAWILDALERAPGIVVLHEFVLHHMLRELTLAAGRPDAYIEELRYAYGDLGEAVGRRAVDHGVPADEASFPLFERVVDRSLGVIVHSAAAAARVERARPRVARWIVPHHAWAGDSEAGPAAEARRSRRLAARRQLGLDPDAFWVGSFGFLTELKRPRALLGGFARLRAERTDARLLVVGEVSRSVARDGLLDGLPDREAREAIRVLGRTELPEFLLAMSAVDVAVNLRWPWGGETSGALLRLLASGTPTVLSDVGSFHEVPDGCAVKVPAGSVDPETEALWVFEALRCLADDPALRAAVGENARAWVTEAHSMRRTVSGYERAIRQAVAEPAAPFAVAPPLERPAAGDVLSRLASGLAEDLFALGFDERDDWVQEELARSLVDLDLDVDGSRARVAARRDRS